MSTSDYFYPLLLSSHTFTEILIFKNSQYENRERIGFIDAQKYL